MPNNNLRLIDIFVHEEDKNPVLDITLYNQSNQTILPTRAKIEVLDVGEFYDCDDDQTRSFTTVTASYGVVLSPSSRGQEQVIKIAHLLRPEESDRFQLVISQQVKDPAPTYVWYLLKVTIVYDEQAYNITSQPLLLSIPPVNPNNNSVWEEEDAPCIAQNKATLSRMASQVANRSASVNKAILSYQPDPPRAQGKPPSLLSRDSNTPGSQVVAPSLNTPIEIFFAYAQEDEAQVKKLDGQLAVSKRNNLLTNWHTGKIGLGRNVQQETLSHLQQAHIVLLLITPSFIQSPQYEIIEEALKQGKVHKKAIIIPVLLRPTAGWKSTFFGDVQVFPRDEKAITSSRQQDQVFAQVAEEIVATVKELKQRDSS